MFTPFLHGVPAGGASGQVLGKTSDANYDSGWLDAAHGVPAGGATAQVLTKATNADYDAVWATPTMKHAGLRIGGTTQVFPSGGFTPITFGAVIYDTDSFAHSDEAGGFDGLTLRFHGLYLVTFQGGAGTNAQWNVSVTPTGTAPAAVGALGQVTTASFLFHHAAGQPSNPLLAAAMGQFSGANDHLTTPTTLQLALLIQEP